MYDHIRWPEHTVLVLLPDGTVAVARNRDAARARLQECSRERMAEGEIQQRIRTVFGDA